MIPHLFLAEIWSFISYLGFVGRRYIHNSENGIGGKNREIRNCIVYLIDTCLCGRI